MRFIAHRFGRAYGPDSSETALERAQSRPLYGLETDCCLTADGDLALLHDDWLPGSTTLDGWARERTAAEIKAARLRSADRTPSPAQPLLLADLLEREHSAELVQLEVKATTDSALAADTARAVCERVRGSTGIEVISFWPVACEIAATEGIPSRLIVACAYLPEALGEWATAHGITGIVLEGHYFDRHVIETWREHGLSVTSGLVNDVVLLERVVAFEPDAVCSDRPHELADELAALT